MKWFLNMKIGIKLISGFLFVALIGLSIGLTGISSLNSMYDQVDEIGVVRLPSIQTLLTISEAQTAVNAVERTLLIYGLSEEDFKGQQERYEAAFIRADEAWKIYAPLPQTDEEAIEWNKFIVEWDEWKNDVKDFMDLAEKYHNLAASDSSAIQNISDQLKEMSLTRNIASFTKAEATLNKIIDINEQVSEESVIKANGVMNSSRIILVTVIVAGIAISIIIGFILSKIISKPLKDMVIAANQIADGDLDIEITLDSKDEVGSLAKAFRTMTENINDVMKNINSASEQVASGSRQVSESSMSLSQGATEQASSIEELTASIEEIASQTRLNASNAGQAKEMATSAQKYAEQGNMQMADMLKAMSEINDSSNNISKIIKVIDDIAFQTNILALNAAVEAARAGQHGKGFAVVAEEVRNLAARSASAAKDTTAMIEGSIKKVEGGTKIANVTAEALYKIVEGVSQATELVGQIASASQDQALGVDQVNQGIIQISQVVQTTSATAQETAAASEELSGQADMLKSQVTTFKLKKTRGNKSYGNEAIDPEVLKMLDNMKASGKLNKSNITKRISLSDSSFEKY